MRAGTLRLLTLILVLICSFQIGLAQEETDAANGVDQVYLAKDDGTGKAGKPVAEFSTTDIPIHCVVMLQSKEPSKVKMVFVAVSVAGVKPETKVVTSAYTTTEGQNIVNFSGRPYGSWTPGKYRVDILINDTLATDVEFLIRHAAKQPVPRSGKSTAVKRPKGSGGPSYP